jgi:ATP-binding cassette subfamily F protein 3
MSDNLLQLQNGAKHFGPKLLFEDASFAINEGEHVGVIGPNGAGKTTLFRVLNNEENLDSGQVVRARKLSLAYLSQHDHWDPNDTGNSFLERTSQIPLWELKALGVGLQLTEERLSQPIVSLSGGYRMRIKLLALLGGRPNLLLLDEPTNYLDLETTLLLERFLQEYEGAFLLISHDREFLRRTTDHILEVEGGDMTKYNGNIDDYFEQKELMRLQLSAQAAGQAKKRQDILDFVARFGAKATKAKQAQSRLKSLAKMESIEIKPVPISTQIRIPDPAHTGKSILRASNASFGYGEKAILSKVSVEVMRGDHVAIVGLNGAGKSTLLKGLTGTLPALQGEVIRGMGVELAFFAQHVVEALDPSDTVLSSLQRAAHQEVKPQEILDLAGSLLFSGDDVKKRISVLSGGEKSRVALGRVLLQKAPCLILDEPTNHLDFQTVEALTLALQKFPGTILVVSHDRGFIRRVGTKILEVRSGGLRLYPGSYDEYVWSLQQYMQEQDSTPVSSAKAPKQEENKGPNLREIRKNLDKELRQKEKKLVECESEMAKVEKESADLNAAMTLAFPTKEQITRLAELGTRAQELETLWLELSEAKERLQAEIAAL